MQGQSLGLIGEEGAAAWCGAIKRLQLCRARVPGLFSVVTDLYWEVDCLLHALVVEYVFLFTWSVTAQVSEGATAVCPFLACIHQKFNSHGSQQ